jgi:hypothetical protein
MSKPSISHIPNTDWGKDEPKKIYLTREMDLLLLWFWNFLFYNNSN